MEACGLRKLKRCPQRLRGGTSGHVGTALARRRCSCQRRNGGGGRREEGGGRGPGEEGEVGTIGGM